MAPDLNMNEPAPHPERVFPRMPRLMEPIAQDPPRRQEGRDRNGNRNNRNQPAAGENNNQEGEDADMPRIPFLLRFFIGAQIRRYMRMRRAVNDARRQNVVAPAIVVPANAANAGQRLSMQGASEPGPSEPGPSAPGSSGPNRSGLRGRPGPSGPGPSSSSRRQ